MMPQRTGSSAVRAIVALVTSLVALVILGLLVPDGPSIADRLDPVLRDLAGGFLKPIVDAFNLAGSLPAWVVLVFLLSALAWPNRGLVVEIVTTAVFVEAAATAVRILVDRPRPDPSAGAELLVASGFPSGHVARTVVLVAAAYLAVPGARGRPSAWILLGIAVVALMAISRVVVGAHYATDTAGGVLLGCAVVAAWAWWRAGRDGHGERPSS